ncbi:MAG: ribosomal L7Ae/L30e/S12e/Gadd45 family protein [Oscillospiraceae bacterium]|nr:ribosomal L7Ae/L30e/S12e/Gadd45 family protein [Oscillospiraceae bacterium]
MADSLRLIGLARRAGFLEYGEETVGASARAGKAKVILIASDASNNTKARGRNFARYGDIPVLEIPFTKEELGAALGKGVTGLISISDAGLASKFVSELAAAEPGKYTEPAQRLALRAEKAAKLREEAAAHRRNQKLGKRRMK